MTGPMEIIDGISRLTAVGLPELQAVYTELAPQRLERPCLLIEADNEDEQSAAASLVKVTSHFTLTLFDETNGHAQSGAERLLRMRSKLLRLFRPGYLRVGDRALSVKASSAGRDWDKAYLDLKFEYMDMRDADAGELPLIESVNTTVGLQGYRRDGASR